MYEKGLGRVEMELVMQVQLSVWVGQICNGDCHSHHRRQCQKSLDTVPNRSLHVASTRGVDVRERIPQTSSVIVCLMAFVVTVVASHF